MLLHLAVVFIAQTVKALVLVDEGLVLCAKVVEKLDHLLGAALHGGVARGGRGSGGGGVGRLRRAPNRIHGAKEALR